MIVENICCYCKHMNRPERRGDSWTCAAFPSGIPDVFARAKESHIHPYPGDGGIQFEPLPEFEKAYGDLVNPSPASESQ